MLRIARLFFMSAILAPGLVLAEGESGEHPYLSNKHTISVGATRQTADAEVRASVGNLPEVGLDLDHLGVDDKDTSWVLEYRWRFKPKWMFVAAGYTFGNDGSIEVSKDFNFDGVEFEAGVGVATDLQVDTYIADLMYQVYRSDKAEVMLGGGLHMIDFSMELEPRLFIGDREVSGKKGTSDILAPLPNLRFQGFYALNNKWAVGLTAGWLSASYDDYDGSFTYAHLRTVYRFLPHFSASVGYQFNAIDLTYEQSHNRETELDVDFDGPTIQLTYIF